MQRVLQVLRAITPIIGAFLILASLSPTRGDERSGNLENTVHQQPPKLSVPFDQTLIVTASWYGVPFHGRLTANGERYDMYHLSAAHKTLPFGSLVRVTNLSNQRSVTVRINDRGPYVRGRSIDLSYAAAQELAMIDHGTAQVRLEVILPALHTTARNALYTTHETTSARQP
jgi:rare lipoprotein A